MKNGKYGERMKKAQKVKVNGENLKVQTVHKGEKKTHEGENKM